MQAGHLGAGAGLVDEHQCVRIEIELSLEPRLAPAQDVGTILLGRMPGLFLSVIRRRLKKRHKPAMLTPIPCPASSARRSANVMSGVLAQASRISAAYASIRPERRSPPCRLGAASPSLRKRACQRIALEALTPNRAAAWRHDAPSSIAAITRLRRSIDSALAMHARPPSPACSLNHIPTPLGILSESVSSKPALGFKSPSRRQFEERPEELPGR